ncbi:terminase small subunit [Bacillus paralicheniformis]|uniref:terminase small subunit n=1 Tax=Bacillus paralicheniformis TaxID=1648923 RepID=UPI002DB5D173|nr:terminase small subunit [Bacillus paralicheniformis]MEC1020304.1 terminase small subunit [Bacillus paralicheniformis]MEC1027202.1 terminase small subunit [Bacillus paralicheniformis]MEC1066326.1 terminase small subunit [Bacillus paralicheniformis]MEC1081948.1 terminase small subunit [Bacillus paralicheniformis]MEC1100383.1 terminase small subunit [Bacillus paralicheniformis]
MPRKRDPKRDEAFRLYQQYGGNITNLAIARELGVSNQKVSVWKTRDRWKEAVNGDDTSRGKADIRNERQRLFCIYYVKSFNATQAAVKAGYSPASAHVTGCRLLKNEKVADEIRRIKKEMVGEIFVEAMDVLQVYVKIAFADMTDYVTFGKKEVQAVGKSGPLFDEENNPVMKEISFVDVKHSDLVDGTVITEAKLGKEGIAIKLADKMKALEKLSQYFDLFPDSFKRKIENEKLKLARQKADKDAESGPVEVVITRKGDSA